MAYTTINKSTSHQDTNIYTANGSGKTISGMGFQPSMIWTKNRTNASYIHAIVDQVRGGTKKMFPNDTSQGESTDANAVTSFTSDGYVFGSSGSFNYSTNTYVNWCWKGAGSGSSNSDGSVTSTVSADTTSGFSVVKWTGTNANATIGHGLGVAPKFIIIRRLAASSTVVYHESLGNTKRLVLDGTGTPSTGSTFFNDTSPTTTTFSVGTDGGSNGSTDDYIAYCFAEKTGYCKIGKYNGNGNNDGTFQYTGFAPKLLVYKNISQTDEWFVHDYRRPGFNPTDLMFWSADTGENTSVERINLLSNGFKTTTTDKGANASNNEYVYIALGQSLVGTNNIPNNAR
jgi:hypothetical protein